MERVKDMLRTKLTGWVQDMQFASKQVEHYEVEEDKDRPGHLIIRRTLLSERLLRYQPWSPSFDDDFSALCKERQPEASQMFSLADELYAFHRFYWYTAADYIYSFYKDDFKIVDSVGPDEWRAGVDAAPRRQSPAGLRAQPRRAHSQRPFTEALQWRGVVLGAPPGEQLTRCTLRCSPPPVVLRPASTYVSLLPRSDTQHLKLSRLSK
ncbi:uncharacterized protein LOC126426543 [Schistocerca serialis cubense]|uniref:uncharacterized protein LOC126426543 n=1 Tax=Schistocerca serialis cubense TaxID=2023355 RepID=UPI00214E1478|nr:uncharacterized protein LOC126426543 [Schistocerca serialis cubense]